MINGQESDEVLPLINGQESDEVLPLEEHEKITAALRGIIRRFIPDFLRIDLPTCCLSKAKVDIMNGATKTFMDIIDTLEIVHCSFELEPQGMTFKPGKRIDKYILCHKKLRRKMHRANYPNIADERASVRMAVNGVALHPRYYEKSRSLLPKWLPDTLDLLEDRFIEEEASIHPTVNGI